MDGLLAGEFEVFKARSGRQGLEALARERPDLAIVDLDMPGMGGLEMIGAFKRCQGATIFIMLTAARDPDSTVSALTAGVVSFLSKPCEPAALRAEVRRLLAAAH